MTFLEALENAVSLRVDETFIRSFNFNIKASIDDIYLDAGHSYQFTSQECKETFYDELSKCWVLTDCFDERYRIEILEVKNNTLLVGDPIVGLTPLKEKLSENPLTTSEDMLLREMIRFYLTDREHEAEEHGEELMGYVYSEVKEEVNKLYNTITKKG